MSQEMLKVYLINYSKLRFSLKTALYYIVPSIMRWIFQAYLQHSLRKSAQIDFAIIGAVRHISQLNRIWNQLVYAAYNIYGFDWLKTNKSNSTWIGVQALRLFD